ncbi:uncharacterized protein LOC107369189 isoform X1 [Tetranychus urticae]|uniref:uncharacterized protein LOC107369189 isoform X1 n=1 Tax=Tetranychus urticae TaxID=32264 RepID=UPI0003567D6C|nr:uncharacterized protein LOC107369189 isoform X1 [Tetranychus urticae]
MLPKETKDCYNNAKSCPLLTPFSSSSSTKCSIKSKRKYHDFTNYSLIVISLILLSTLDTVSSLTCEVNQYLCADGNQCIIETYLCDNDKDCEDGSDETRCSPPSLVDADFGDRFLREGEDLSLSCQAVGFPTPLIRWKFNDHIITSHNSRYRNTSINGHGKLSITGVRKEDEGTYECVAENANNYISSNSVVKLRVRTERERFHESKRVKDHSQYRDPLTRSAPSEDAVLLRQITNNYSAPLVASFLHSRIQKTIQMVRDIKNSLNDLSQDQRSFFNLKVKSLEALDKQLTSLQKINYFNFDGTERIQYLIEQYIMNNEILPIESALKEVKFNSTLDDLLQQVNVTSNDILIKYTNDLIKVFLQDIEEREVNKKYNELQRFAAFLTKRKLEPLINLQYWPADHLGHDGQFIGTIDNRGSQIEFVLHQLKDTLDLFYTQFENLATQRTPSSSLESVTSKVKGTALVTNDTDNYLMPLSID